MAERLGTGLQNPLHRFESGSDLPKTPQIIGAFLFFLHYLHITLYNIEHKLND